ncbi:19028_t:CDS:2 [Rhizophagus irregularis]|nr:19028_t:CDS:2 [Rhizophagus irregularis]
MVSGKFAEAGAIFEGGGVLSLMIGVKGTSGVQYLVTAESNLHCHRFLPFHLIRDEELKESTVGRSVLCNILSESFSGGVRSPS